MGEKAVKGECLCEDCDYATCLCQQCESRKTCDSDEDCVYAPPKTKKHKRQDKKAGAPPIAKQNKGGTAFPSAVGDVGMTLRDYFAGQALAGLTVDFVNQISQQVSIDDVVRRAYYFADAMLAERQKRHDKDNG